MAEQLLRTDGVDGTDEEDTDAGSPEDRTLDEIIEAYAGL